MPDGIITYIEKWETMSYMYSLLGIFNQWKYFIFLQEYNLSIWRPLCTSKIVLAKINNKNVSVFYHNSTVYSVEPYVKL